MFKNVVCLHVTNRYGTCYTSSWFRHTIFDHDWEIVNRKSSRQLQQRKRASSVCVCKNQLLGRWLQCRGQTLKNRLGEEKKCIGIVNAFHDSIMGSSPRLHWTDWSVLCSHVNTCFYTAEGYTLGGVLYRGRHLYTTWIFSIQHKEAITLRHITVIQSRLK